MGKSTIRTSFLFALYQLALVYFFDLYSFFNNESSSLLFYGSSFALSFALHSLVNGIIRKLDCKLEIKKILFPASFIISAIFTSLVCWFLFAKTNTIVLLVIASFAIPAFLPSILFFLKDIFAGTEKEVNWEESAMTDEEPKTEVEQNIRFVLHNDSGKKLLDISTLRILCFEANDNYVVTYYIDKEENLKKAMERVSLKKIEEILAQLNVVTFKRVHKSYLINQLFLEEIKGKAQAQKLKLKYLEILIPVSRSFDLSSLEQPEMD